MFLWVLMAFLVIAGLGLFLIEVDVVVSARGKIIPAGDVKTLQPLETGVVSGIHVKEGDYVAKGATLVEIDPSLDTADLEGKEKNLRFSRAASQRINAVLGGEPFRPSADTEPELAQAQRHLYETQRAVYRSTISEKEKALREAEASLQGLREERKRLESIHRLVTEEEKRQQALVQIGALAENRYREKVKERLQTEKELEMKRGQEEEVTWRVQRVREEMETVRGTFREKLLRNFRETSRAAAHPRVGSEQHSLPQAKTPDRGTCERHDPPAPRENGGRRCDAGPAVGEPGPREYADYRQHPCRQPRRRLCEAGPGMHRQGRRIRLPEIRYRRRLV